MCVNSAHEPHPSAKLLQRPQSDLMFISCAQEEMDDVVNKVVGGASTPAEKSRVQALQEKLAKMIEYGASGALICTSQRRAHCRLRQRSRT